MKVLIFISLIFVLACAQPTAGPDTSTPVAESPASAELTLIEYLETTMEIFERAGKYSATTSALSEAFVDTPAWRERSLSNAYDLTSSYDELKVINPPALFSEVHENYILAFEHMAEAGRLRIASIESLEAGDIESATAFIIQSAAKTKEANQQLAFAKILFDDIPRP